MLPTLEQIEQISPLACNKVPRTPRIIPQFTIPYGCGRSSSESVSDDVVEQLGPLAVTSVSERLPLIDPVEGGVDAQLLEASTGGVDQRGQPVGHVV